MKKVFITVMLSIFLWAIPTTIRADNSIAQGATFFSYTVGDVDSSNTSGNLNSGTMQVISSKKIPQTGLVDVEQATTRRMFFISLILFLIFLVAYRKQVGNDMNVTRVNDSMKRGEFNE